ncbi:hypothetical protein OG946_24705 [Streptomyces sp. NBC_01808]|uniref:hypothetical protein n=1 Tax=Streptomyces sp. NBC_01808 TaxID=2975947 RepID=UPI002DDC72EE|nr:hypothetical protein [Streptomyces sp. NBC_01808]WSA40283.1 hypothetical protein OG946_24705 [Streptomyces sp. NBC_01808]
MPDPNMRERGHAFRVRHLMNDDTAQKEANNWVNAGLRGARYLYHQHIHRMALDIQGIRPGGHLASNTDHLRFDLTGDEKSMEEQAYNLFRKDFRKLKEQVSRPNYGEVNWDQAFELNETLFNRVRVAAQRKLREVLEHNPAPDYAAATRQVNQNPRPLHGRNPARPPAYTPNPAYTVRPEGPSLPAYGEAAAAAPLSPVGSSQSVRSLSPVTDVARSSTPAGQSQMPPGGHAQSQPRRTPSR